MVRRARPPLFEKLPDIVPAPDAGLDRPVLDLGWTGRAGLE
ncbi:MAG: hypothetical protein QME96_11650 [Myxococcota bacterium]|nr:hypothetical protein [Myxococcota bacterium]